MTQHKETKQPEEAMQHKEAKQHKEASQRKAVKQHEEASQRKAAKQHKDASQHKAVKQHEETSQHKTAKQREETSQRKETKQHEETSQRKETKQHEETSQRKTAKRHEETSRRNAAKQHEETTQHKETKQHEETSQIIKTDKPEEQEIRQEGRRFPINIHVILLAAIVLVIGFSAFRLYQWDKGERIEYDPNAQTTDFDVEALDNIIPLAPDKREGYEDDGITTILCLGDDPFSLEQGENGLAEQIAKKTGATVYNGSFTGTTIAPASATFSEGDMMDAFSFLYVALSLANGDFGLMKTAATYSTDEMFSVTTDMLSKLDMNNVDIICIMYDASDYINKRICDDPNEPLNPITYTGALRLGVQEIQKAYPHIRIVVMSHTFCHTINEEGNFENGDRVDLGHGTLSHYLQKQRDATMDCGISFIDNFYGSVNEDNYLNYMTDYIHFNDAGRELLATRFAECIFPNKEE